MATKIIRYSNRAEFKIENLVVDFATEDVEVVDYVHIDENHIYFIGGSYKELKDNVIGRKPLLTTISIALMIAMN